jgi:hypothetical protein
MLENAPPRFFAASIQLEVSSGQRLFRFYGVATLVIPAS